MYAMTKTKGFAGRAKYANPLIIMSLAFDVLTLLCITGNDLGSCTHQSFVSGYSILAIILAMDVMFVIVACTYLGIKYSKVVDLKQECKECCHLCPCTKKEWKNCYQLTSHLCYDILSVFMGFCYLLGDNLSDEVCMTKECMDNSLTKYFNTSTCMLSINQTCDTVNCAKRAFHPECNLSRVDKLLLPFWVCLHF